MSFFGVLTIVFIVLKLIGVISWSWGLVLLPLYGPLTIIALFYIITGIISVVISHKGGK